ncbi:MAG TPA: hypothetical protein VEZ88_13330 [Steroidobacteraceae bacterium]|nr:hypothetical protein [Steroidobacteraceae bacterium]
MKCHAGCTQEVLIAKVAEPRSLGTRLADFIKREATGCEAVTSANCVAAND